MTEQQRERYDEARQEARQDEAEENECPCCHGQLKRTRAHDEIGMVGQGVECANCGFASGTEYGQNYLELPDGWRENDQGEIVNEDDEVVLEEEE
jgi:hypothetical protein